MSIIGAPCDLGGNRRGAAMGPAALRTAGIVERFASLGVPVVDDGDALVPRECGEPGDPRKRFINHIAAVGNELFRLASTALRNGSIPVVLGGDHSISAGSVAASATHLRDRFGSSLGVIWVDAHGDMNTPATTLTGNVHGMPLAALIGDEPAELSSIGGWTRKVAPEHVVLVGVRSLDDEEQRAIEAAGIHVYTMDDIRRRGVEDVMREALLRLEGTAGVHVSLDLDACDPEEAPGVSTPVEGGLSRAALHTIMQTVSSAADIVSFDIVEVNPACDVRNVTAELGIELALSALAGRDAV